MKPVPGDFPSLRESQLLMASIISEAAEALENSIQCHCAPTGTGKTLAYMTGACWSNRRAAVLTHTKALQDQILRDFHREAYDIRGAGNFRCCRAERCDLGMLYGCEEPSCPYRLQFSKSASYSIIVTNYAMWASAVLGRDPLGQFGIVVCDEAHLLDSALTSACTLRLDEEEALIVKLPAAGLLDLKQLRGSLLALNSLPSPRDPSQKLRADRNKQLSSSLLSIKKHDLPMLVYRSKDFYLVSSLWPSVWFNSLIRPKAPLTVLASATISDRQAEMITGRNDISHYSYPSPFDPGNAPVYLMPRGSMRHGGDPETVRQVFRQAIAITRHRKGSRGIIHTVSHSRAVSFYSYALSHDPEAASRMLLDEPRSDAKARFLSVSDAVLVSASAGTGHDFPDDACRWQVVLKAPYPDLSDPLIKARCEADSGYMSVMMASALTQICGRNVRHEEDYGETFILDTLACRAFDSGPSLFPDWLRARVRRASSMAVLKPKH